MKFKILVIFIIISTSLSAQRKATLEEILTNLDKFPSYDSVVKRFYDRYIPSDTAIISFGRKIDGWYIYSKNVNDLTKISRENIFWSYEYMAFRNIPYPVNKDDIFKKDYKKFLDPYTQDGFKIHPLYGYEGWDKDVIFIFKQFENLPDTVLYALGRAYSNYALGLIRKQYSYHTGDNNTGYEKTGSETVKNFLENARNAIASFKKLYDRNPAFETIVGNIHTKYSNEYLSVWHTLKSIKEDELAQEFLPKGLYDGFIIAWAKNILTSCQPNAILFTGGDNDTYALWYVQTKLNFRKDVQVLNISLLSTNWYIAMVLDEADKADNPIPFAISPEKYSKRRYDYIYIIENDTIVNTEKPQSLQKMLEFALSDDTKTKYLARNGEYVAYLPTSKLQLNVDKETIVKNPSVPEDKHAFIRRSVEWNLSSRYLMKNQFIILEILAENNWARPVYFSSAMATSNYLGLDDYLQLDGLAYQLVPIKDDQKDEFTGSVNADLTWDLYVNKFDWNGIKEKTKDEDFKSRMINNYRFLFGRLANTLILENKKEKAKQALDKAFLLFPETKYPYDYFALEICNSYYKLGNLQRGNYMANAMSDHFLTRLEELKNNPADHPEVASIDQEIKMAEFVIYQIIKILSENNQTELKDKIEKRFKEGLH